ncbi:MAG: aspartate aminotransferase family protein [Alkaliphilus sp.]|nr:aspartate aminotransferase family protein [Alkaliphilus sp.]
MNNNLEKTMTLIERDAQVYPRFARIPYYPLVVNKGEGAIIEDFDGNRFIDLLSSASALNTGHAHPRIVNAITEQAKRYITYTAAYMYSEPLVKLGEVLADITPGNYKKKVAYGLSGSDANDGVIKLARAYTGRRTIVSFIGAYHGSTYGALSLSAISLNMRRKIGPLLSDIEHIEYPDCYRCRYEKEVVSCSLECMLAFEKALATYCPPEEIAAVIIEPIQGDGGLIVPPKKYMDYLYKICQKHRILFVSEEVQQGFGRTGKWFGIEHFDIVPDILVLGKSIASGMPLSAIVAKSELMDALDSPAHLFTMSGNALSCMAAYETIRIIQDEKLVEKSQELGEVAMEKFRGMMERYQLIGDVRGRGLSIGIDLVQDRHTKVGAREAAAKICYRCWEKGVILIFLGNGVLRFQPPLVIKREEMEHAMNIIEESIHDYLEGLIPDEVLKVSKGW